MWRRVVHLLSAINPRRAKTQQEKDRAEREKIRNLENLVSRLEIEAEILTQGTYPKDLENDPGSSH